MSIFNGIENAEIFERGKYLAGGFNGVVECQRTLTKETIKSGIGFIVEFKIIETNLPEEHAVGSRATWFQKMGDKTVAFPAVKAWASAMAGYHPHQKQEIENEVAPHLSETLAAATENETDNVFTGVAVRVSTETVITRNGREFTRHQWAPLS